MPENASQNKTVYLHIKRANFDCPKTETAQILLTKNNNCLPLEDGNDTLLRSVTECQFRPPNDSEEENTDLHRVGCLKPRIFGGYLSCSSAITHTRTHSVTVFNWYTTERCSSLGWLSIGMFTVTRTSI
jgi:hypothetical protein